MKKLRNFILLGATLMVLTGSVLKFQPAHADKPKTQDIIISSDFVELNVEELEELDFEEITDNELTVANQRTATKKVTRGSKPKPKKQVIKTIKAQPHKSFKSYMAWTKLAKNSPQRKLCAKAKPNPKNAIMMYEGRYLVALGFAYSDKIGDKFDVVLENGQIIPVMVGDWKATKDTINNSTTKHDGSIIEFIVSGNKAASIAVNRTGNYNTIFPGKVKEFRKIK